MKTPKPLKMYLLPKESWPLKNDYFEDPNPCYTGSNPSFGGSKDS